MSKKILDEPKFLFPLTKIDVIKALNWYNQNVDYSDSLEWGSDYIRKNHDIEISLTKDYVVYGYVSRLLSNGHILPDNNLIWHTNKTQEIINSSNARKRISNQNPIPEKVVKKLDNTINVLSEIDSMLDTMIRTKFVSMPKIQSLSLIKSINKDSIIKHSKDQLNEFQEALNDDDDLKEGYSNFSSGEIKKIINFFHSIITLFTHTKVPRKKKTKLANTLKYFKYQKSYSDINLTSIDPIKIIGAKAVWIYNTRYKKIIRLNAKEDSGLGIHRSGIENFDETLSKCKVLRKPEDVIPKILDGGKIFLRDFFDTLKTKESKLTNRINEDCIILRIQS